MVNQRRRERTQKSASPAKENAQKQENEYAKNEGTLGYEKLREQRIKENKDRLQKLGILELSGKLKSEKIASSKRSFKDPSEKKSVEGSEPSRRSSRIKTLAPVSYVEVRVPGVKPVRNLEIHIPEGSKPEFYTEEQVKLLGDSKTDWTMMVDGYGEHGQRIYDPVNGKSCHQCRQKTLGQRTACSKCKTVQGQFCGDCLYSRYGENVLEAKENANWICPTCRGICNCSRCRRSKGWAPTGNLYHKVIGLGYKSVAHYLIQTKQAVKNSEETETGKTEMAHEECNKPAGESWNSGVPDSKDEDTNMMDEEGN